MLQHLVFWEVSQLWLLPCFVHLGFSDLCIKGCAYFVRHELPGHGAMAVLHGCVRDTDICAGDSGASTPSSSSATITGAPSSSTTSSSAPLTGAASSSAASSSASSCSSLTAATSSSAASSSAPPTRRDSLVLPSRRLHVKTSLAVPLAVSQLFAESAEHCLGAESQSERFPSVASWSPDKITALREDIGTFLQRDQENGGCSSREWPELIRAAYPHVFHSGATLAMMLLMLVLRCWRNQDDTCVANHDFVELSSGTANLTLQCLLLGLRGARFDKLYAEEHNCLHPGGLRLWLNHLGLIRKGGSVWSWLVKIVVGGQPSSWESKRCNTFLFFRLTFVI